MNTAYTAPGATHSARSIKARVVTWVALVVAVIAAVALVATSGHHNTVQGCTAAIVHIDETSPTFTMPGECSGLNPADMKIVWRNVNAEVNAWAKTS